MSTETVWLIIAIIVVIYFIYPRDKYTNAIAAAVVSTTNAVEAAVVNASNAVEAAVNKTNTVEVASLTASMVVDKLTNVNPSSYKTDQELSLREKYNLLFTK